MKCHAVHSVKDGSVVCRAGFDKMWCPGVKDVRVYVYFFPSPTPPTLLCTCQEVKVGQFHVMLNKLADRASIFN